MVACVCVTEEVTKGDSVQGRESGFIQAAAEGLGSVEGETGMRFGRVGLARTLLQCSSSTQRQEVDSFKIACHGNRRMRVLPCFLIVKSSLTVVSQFLLFLSPAEHRCWKCLWPRLGRTVCGAEMGQRGHRWPPCWALPCHGGHGPRAGAERGEPLPAGRG